MVKSSFGNTIVHRFAKYQLKCPYYDVHVVYNLIVESLHDSAIVHRKKVSL